MPRVRPLKVKTKRQKQIKALAWHSRLPLSITKILSSLILPKQSRKEVVRANREVTWGDFAILTVGHSCLPTLSCPDHCMNGTDTAQIGCQSSGGSWTWVWVILTSEQVCGHREHELHVTTGYAMGICRNNWGILSGPGCVGKRAFPAIVPIPGTTVGRGITHYKSRRKEPTLY